MLSLQISLGYHNCTVTSRRASKDISGVLQDKFRRSTAKYVVFTYTQKHNTPHKDNIHSNESAESCGEINKTADLVRNKNL